MGERSQIKKLTSNQWPQLIRNKSNSVWCKIVSLFKNMAFAYGKY